MTSDLAARLAQLRRLLPTIADPNQAAIVEAVVLMGEIILRERAAAALRAPSAPVQSWLK